MNTTITVIVTSLGGILAGVAALVSALFTIRRNKSAQKVEADTSEITLGAIEKLFEHQTMLNKLFLDRIQSIEENIKEMKN